MTGDRYVATVQLVFALKPDYPNAKRWLQDELDNIGWDDGPLIVETAAIYHFAKLEMPGVPATI